MTNINFSPLHLHTEFSLLDGATKITKLPERLKELGMTACAITDHGEMGGVAKFEKALRKAGIKPILGCEIYMTDDRSNIVRDTKTWHLTLLASNREGYSNLSSITSHAHISSQKTMPGGRRVGVADWKLMKEYNKGIICLSGCMGAPVMGEIMHGGSLDIARDKLSRLIDTFGKENVYGEIQDAGVEVYIPADSQVGKLLQEHRGRKVLIDDEGEKSVICSQADGNWVLVEHLCKPINLPYVVTGDTHYLHAEDAQNHDALICAGTGQKIRGGRRRFSLLPQKYYLKSKEEMSELFADYPEAIERTQEIVDRCSDEEVIEYGVNMVPKFPIPEGFKDANDYLKHLVYKGLETRYGSERGPEVDERAEYELGIIIEMGFVDFFLIIADWIDWCRERDIPIGPGRGSAAGSIVSYALGVTAVDPLEFDLLFERFLDVNRVSLPDIDIDISQGQLQEPRQYVRDKYNALASELYKQEVETAVTQIGTLGRYKPKAAIKASARVLNVFHMDGMNPEDANKAVKDGMKLGDKLSNFIPKLKLPSGNKMTMENCLNEISDLKKAYENDPKAKEIIELAKFFENYISNFGVHAAAVIINDRPLERLIPLRRASAADPITTAFEQEEDEDVGTLKQDFLGLKTLDVIWDTKRMIREEHGNNILDPWSRKYIPWDDKPTWDLLSRAESIGVFQVESPGMQHVLKSVRPDNMGHLSDIVALFRPGPMDSIPSYARRKNGHEDISYGDARLEDVLGPTYSILVYQEQIMRVSRDLAGFTPQEADGLRKAVGKKLADKIAQIKKPFYDGCRKNKVPAQVIDELWVTIEAAGRYAFNKSHSVCYALIAYVTAYLKANYPAAFMAASLSINIGHKDKMPILLNECRRMNLRVLPPDVNRSGVGFSIYKNLDEHVAEHGTHEILFGLSAVAGVGGKVVEKLIAEREMNGPFTDFYEFVKRAHFLSSAQMESLVKAGALDAFVPSRKGAFAQVKPTLERYKKEYDDKVKERKKMYRQHAKLAFHEARGAEGKAPTLSGPEKRLAEAVAKHEVDDGRTPENLLELALTAQTADWELGVRRELKKAYPDFIKAEIDEMIADRHDKEVTRLRSEAKAMLPGIKDSVVRVHEQLQKEGDTHSMLEQLAKSFPALSKEEWPRLEKLNYEREVIKLFVSGHPLDEDIEAWTRFISIGLGEVSDKYIGWEVLICGVITASEYKTFPSGFALHRIVLDDLTGSREVTLFKSAVEDGSHKFLEVGNIISMIATIEEDTFASNQDSEDDEDESKAVKLSGKRVRIWDPAERKTGPILVTFPEDADVDVLKKAVSIIKNYPGDHEIMLKRSRYAEPKKAPYGVEMNHVLFRELRRLVGRRNVI